MILLRVLASPIALVLVLLIILLFEDCKFDDAMADLWSWIKGD